MKHPLGFNPNEAYEGQNPPTPERDRGDEHPMSKQMRGILVINKTPPGYRELLNSWADEMDRLLAQLDAKEQRIIELTEAIHEMEAKL